jgi:hypothetical protein
MKATPTKPKAKAKAKPAAPKAGSRTLSDVVANGEAAAKSRKAPRAAVHYTPELGKKICDLIAEGGSIPKICAMPGMPSDRALWNWERQHEDFAKAIEQARERRADARFEAIAALAEEVRVGTLGHAEGRLVIDTWKYLASKDAPRRYGDKPVSVDVKVGVGIQGQVDTAQWIRGVLGVEDSSKGSNVVALLPPKEQAE